MDDLQTSVFGVGTRTGRRPSPPVVWLIALGGSVGGTLAAAVENSAHAMNPLMGVLLLVAVAPAVEEICKPLAIVFLLDKRPGWLRSPWEIIALAAVSAAVFATLENLLYIFVNYRQGSAAFVAYRLMVCTAVHVAASVVFGFGLVKMWRHIRAGGGRFDIDVCFRYYVAAAVIHGCYNGAAFLLTWLGVLRF